MKRSEPVVTICVLTFGDYPELAKRCLSSILHYLDRDHYHLVVGANAVGERTEAYLETLHAQGKIDRLIKSPININKCPMMRRMFELIDTEFVWWLDDDSSIVGESALDDFLNGAREAPMNDVMWGKLLYTDWSPDQLHGPDFAQQFVRTAKWYQSLSPPSWDPGGKGEMNFRNKGGGDGRWFFIVGGCWWMRMSAIKALDWPDPRLIKGNDDIYLGEAVRQQGWRIVHVDFPVAIDQSERRGNAGYSNLESIQSLGETDR